jgi:glycosyltransferase involved in cell wall biosynthesis
VAEPVRVLIVAPAPLGETRIGGIANFIRGFVRHMPEDFTAEIVGVAVADEDPGSGWRERSFAGRQVRFLPVARIDAPRRSGRVPVKARILVGMLRARRQLRTDGRVVQLHAPAMGIGLVGRRAPRVRVVHGAPENLLSSRSQSTWRRIPWGLRLAENFAFGRADLVYFVGRAEHAQYAARMSDARSRMHFLPNWVDTTQFRPLVGDERSAARTRLASELMVPTGSRWLLFAGRLDDEKDPLLLLRAFAVANAGRADRADLLIAGDGRLRAASERLAAELRISENVRFLGTVPQDRLAEIMSAGDGFVLSSAFELGPTVVYEALASGLPVAATRVGEVSNLVQHGITGWIAEGRTEQALAAAIEWVLSQPPTGLAQRCAESMAPYHPATVLSPFYAAHRDLAAASKRQPAA